MFCQQQLASTNSVISQINISQIGIYIHREEIEMSTLGQITSEFKTRIGTLTLIARLINSIRSSHLVIRSIDVNSVQLILSVQSSLINSALYFIFAVF